ncbi:unnamed protein product [Acanthoscelides obtectus]|uniref:DUF4817 domain-containing protein n=1 Tax=Acanthoscelides obtectus TaxID=200917 RepID=A0A9P0PVV8_ACAOB|nr:unnamed protein product [Acanthoscelides obtectus]CAK1651517.1 Protein ZBED8 [Acanthoscelides obtectus]
MFASTSQRNDDGLRASYNISLLIAKSGKPYTIGEKLIFPAVEEVLKTVLRKPTFDIIKRIPLSNNTVERRIDEMSSDIESFLCNYLQTTHFSIQLDESTLPDNAALLLAYVRFIMNQEIDEELLFVRTLITDTKGESIFHVLKDYFIEKAIPLSNIISVATDGAPAMVGQVQVSKTKVWQTLRPRVQALQPDDFPARVRFCEWLLHQHDNNPDFLKCILVTDESTFTRNGVNNFRNTHVRSFSTNIFGECLGWHDFSRNILPSLLEDVPLSVRQSIRLTNEQPLQIIEFYYQNSCSVKRVHRALLPIYGQFGRPAEGAIRKLVIKFRTQFILLDIKPPTRRRRVMTEENIAAVSASVSDDREMSIRRRSQQLGICYSTTWKILRQDLDVKPYKIQLVQELKPHDLPQRFQFAHFWLNGYVNKQNCRIWSEDQPEALQELPMHPEKITVWCGLQAGGIIGPYFFKDDNGRNVTVNGERYQLDLADMWFQQDGATCHTAHETMALLSCDLTPLDYFLWGHVKANIYGDKPATIDALEANIEAFIREIPADMLERVCQNWTLCMGHLKRSRGPHLHEITFKH